MKKYYIVDNYNRSDLFDYLVKDDCGGLFNVEFLSLNNLLAKLNFNNELNVFKLNKIIKDLVFQNKIKRFKNIVDDYSFLNKIIKFNLELEKYNINPSDLEIDVELKIILNSIERKDVVDLKDKIKDLDFSNYTIVPSFDDIFNQEIIDLIVDKGAKILKLNSNNNDTKLIIGNNPKDEIEKIAYYIKENKLENEKIGLILFDQSYLNNVKSIFKKYDLTFNIAYDSDFNCISNAMVRMLDFYLDSTIENYLKLVNHNIFTLSNSQINEYVLNHLKSSDELYSEFNKFQNNEILSEKENKYYLDLEKRSNDIHLKYLDFINEIKKLNFIGAIEYTYNLLIENHLFNDKEKLSLKSYLERNFNFLDLDNYKLIREELLNLKINNNKNTSNITIARNDQKLFNQNYIFVLKAEQNSYPNFKYLDSYFNEDTILKTSYPKLQDRYKNHLNQLKWFNDAKTTFFSYPHSSISGKEYKLSSYLDVKNELKINLPTKKTLTFKPNYSLKKENVSKLFLKDGIFYTSVSALEYYAKCPYYYLLKYGFNLGYNNKIELNNALFGTMMHKVFERFFKDNKKVVENSYIDDILKEYFDKIDFIYPKNVQMHQDVKVMIIDRLIYNLKKSLNYQNNNYFDKSIQEVEINEKLFDDTIIRGRIDRVDYNDRNYRLIDYKSSKHSLNGKGKSLPSIFTKGLLLQLHLYNYVYEKQTKLKSSGIYYFNILNEKSELEFYELSNGFIQKDGLLKQDNSLFKGINYDIENLYDDFKEVGAGVNKDGAIKNLSKISLEEYHQKTLELVSILKTKILNGEFPLNIQAKVSHYDNFETLTHIRDKGEDFDYIK